ncbi:hypothetical protein ACK3TF_004580 [Chlorella vulgaris]
MGIIVPELTLENTGVHLTNAYLAFSRNALVVQPTEDNMAYIVRGSYGIWNSEADKTSGKDPLVNSFLDTLVTDPQALMACMSSIYGKLKSKYPTSVDVLEGGQADPDEDPAPPEDTPEDPVPDDTPEDPEDPAPPEDTPEDPAPDDTPVDPTPEDTPEDPAPVDPAPE